MENKLLVIIITYNAMKWADRCFDSLRDSSVPNDVFVVDNGSTDGTQEFIKKNYPEINFHQSAENLGFGKANNIGLQYALDNGYDYVYLLNQDAWVLSDTFQILIEESLKYPEYGILSPMQMQSNMNYFDANFKDGVLGDPKSGILNMFEDIYMNSCKDLYSVDFVMAAHWLIPVPILNEVGLFSTAFPHYGEDANICFRMKYWGYKIGVCLRSKAIHDRELRPSDSDKQKVYKTYITYIDRINNINNNQSLFYNTIKLIRFSGRILLRYKDASLRYKFVHICKMIESLKESSNYRAMYKEHGAFISK